MRRRAILSENVTPRTLATGTSLAMARALNVLAESFLTAEEGTQWRQLMCLTLGHGHGPGAGWCCRELDC